MSTLLVTLHVVGAVFIVGPMVVLPMIALSSIRARSANVVTRLAKTTNLFSMLSVVVFALGFGALAFASPKDNLTVFTPWISGSVILYLAAASLSLFVTVPAMRTEAIALAARAAQRERTSVVSRGYRLIAWSSGFAALGLLAVVVLMVWKP
jgi:uncharacterized membrane protein